jgi:hypothetical protein
MKKIFLILNLALCLSINLKSKAQSTVTTYTITPQQNSSSVNVSTMIKTSGGSTSIYPTNSIYPVFSKDSTDVTWFSTFTGDKVISNATPITNYWTGSFNFPAKGVKSVDSLYDCCMTK